MQLCYNANASDVDSLSTESDGTNRQPPGRGRGECEGKDADIGYQWVPVIECVKYNVSHPGIHLSTYTDIQCLRHQG
jgi:hypothetical protein